jgi:hypothetical protein
MATRDYTLGKGKVLFQPDGTDGYIDLGNAPAFAVNVTIEKLEHFSSREGLSKKDLEVITRLGMGGSFTLDEPNAENLRMFFMSTEATTDAQASGSTAAASIANIVLDRWYQMTLAGTGTASLPGAGATTGASENTGTAELTISGSLAAVTRAHTVKVKVVTTGATGTIQLSLDGGDWGTARSLTGSAYTGVAGDGELNGVIFTFDDGTLNAVGDIFSFAIDYSGATRLTNLTSATVSGSVENTDFVLDKAAGLFMALSGGNIAAAATVTFATTVYSANSTRTTTDGGTLTSLKGDLYFVGNPPTGRIVDVQGYCSLTPNGDFAAIGTDWMQVGFTVEFLEVTGVPGLVQVTDRGKIG